eukprot:jgi/Botrbrau1/17605/Bobra.0166s0042.1
MLPSDSLGLGVEDRNLSLDCLFNFEQTGVDWQKKCHALVMPWQEFTLANVESHHHYLHGLYDLVFRPANCNGGIDADACVVGIPSYMARGWGGSRPRYFFVEMRPGSRHSRQGMEELSRASSSSIACSTTDSVVLLPALRPAHGASAPHGPSDGLRGWKAAVLGVSPIDGLKIRSLLSISETATVYHATLNSSDVALKVIPLPGAVETGTRLEDLQKAVQEAEPDRVEAAHPHLLATREIWVLPLHSLPAPVPPEGDVPVLWALLEYCAGGTLLELIEKGWFRNPIGSVVGETRWLAVLDVASQVAEGLLVLHRQGLPHGALSSTCVLVSSGDGEEGREGVAVKVDPGSAFWGLPSSIVPQRQARIAYLAPELLSGGKEPSMAADVYAFGVICWELASHIRAWANCLQDEVLAAVVDRRHPLAFGDNPEPHFAMLARVCMAFQPAARPKMSEVLESLNLIKQGQAHPPNQT